MSVTLHTSHGAIKIELYCDKVPRACFNFLALAASGAYDKTLFHRNMKGFMLQGGDPTGTGKGGESIHGGSNMPDDFNSELSHNQRGVVAFSNNGGADTIGSQFYITYGPQLHINNKFTIFGQVIDGHDVLDSIERVPVGKKNRPVSDVTLDSVTIHANPLAA